VSTVFRAPSLGQSVVSSTATNFLNLGQGLVPGESLTLPVDSPAARGLGAVPLEPEHSTNASAGVVVTPLPAAPAVVPQMIATPMVPPSAVPVAEAAATDDVKELTELLGLSKGDDVETALFNPAEPFNVPLPPVAVVAPAAGVKRPTTNKKWIAAAAAVVILGTAGVASYKFLGREAAPAMATLSVQSNPIGVPVFVDGIERGSTPARITLAPGSHILELRRGVPRVIPVTAPASASPRRWVRARPPSA
jgi:hypothetical protein